MQHPGRLRWALVVGLLAALPAAQATPASLASFSGAAIVPGNAIAIGHWSTPAPSATPAAATTYYLHNNPSPPGGNTAAQPSLPMSTLAPTGGTLYDYAVDCLALPGRSLLTRNGSSATCSTVSWRTPTLTASRQIQGTLTFLAWYRLDVDPGGKNIVLDVSVDDFDPATGSVASIAAAAGLTWSSPGGTAPGPHAISLTASYTVPAGHQIELVVHGDQPTYAQRAIVVAYDTLTYPASLSLP